MAAQMQRWRSAYDEGVARFVCICVDGRPEETAREFQKLYFDNTMTNTFIDDRDDFPTFQAGGGGGRLFTPHFKPP